MAKAQCTQHLKHPGGATLMPAVLGLAVFSLLGAWVLMACTTPHNVPPGSRPGIVSGAWVKRDKVDHSGALQAMFPHLPKFPVFDEIGHRRKPDLTKVGLSKIQVLYKHELWGRGVDDSQPDERKLRWWARRLDPNIPICLDIEHWPVKRVSDAQARRNMKKLMRVVSIMKSVNPKLRLGFYGILPPRNYWSVYRSGQDKDMPKVKTWRDRVELLKPLGRKVDILFPSVYAPYRRPDRWRVMATELLRRARVYDKPVVPFVWPEIHHQATDESGPRGYLTREHWQVMLNTCYQEADGMVVWAGRRAPRNLLWDDDRTWYRVLRGFLRGIRQAEEPAASVGTGLARPRFSAAAPR
jgi:hypothetical protein